MEVKRPSRSIEQWYERAVNLDRHWRESRWEKERLRRRREIGALAQRVNISVAASKIQEQWMPQP